MLRSSSEKVQVIPMKNWRIPLFNTCIELHTKNLCVPTVELASEQKYWLWLNSFQSSLLEELPEVAVVSTGDYHKIDVISRVEIGGLSFTCFFEPILPDETTPRYRTTEGVTPPSKKDGAISVHLHYSCYGVISDRVRLNQLWRKAQLLARWKSS